MDPLDYAKTPTGRKFGATGSLVGQPSILERRQAVTDMATLNARRSSDYNRVYRQARRASRQGDMEAGLLALELGDLASKEGVELGGIRRYGQRMNAAEDELDQKIRTNQELIDAEAGNPQAAPAASGAMTVTAQGWTPNETLTTAPAASGAMTVTAQGWTPNETLATAPEQAQEGIVGGPSGIDATPIRSGPSPAEGGIMAARNRSVSPIYSSRGIEQQTPPQSLDPNYGPPVGSVSTDFDKKFPALSAFMKRAGEVDYTMGDTGPDTEQDVANYRFDESLSEDEKKRRMAKRAKTERVDFSLAERSRRLRESRAPFAAAGSGAPGTRVITRGTTF